MDGKFDRNTFFDFLEIRFHRKRDFAHNGRTQFQQNFNQTYSFAICLHGWTDLWMDG